MKTSYAYQLDWGGSVVGLTTATGATIATYAYDPWGRELSRTGSLADVNPLRYRGYVADDETGLYYLPARYYDPAIARFTSVDPAPPKAGNPQSLNGYVYCEDDPVTFTDPDGRDILFGNYYPSGTQDRYEPDIPQRQGSRSRGAHGTSSSGQRERRAADARRAAPPVTTLHQPTGFVPVLSMADRYLTAGVVGSLGAVAAYAVSAGALATYGALSPAAVEAAQRVASTVGDPNDEISLFNGQSLRYTQYALDRMAGSRGDCGMAQWAVERTVASPTSVVLQQNGRYLLQSDWGTVIMEPNGVVMNVIPTAGSIAGYGSVAP